MVKIKDFTLASKNLGGGRSYTTPTHDCTYSAGIRKQDSNY